MSYAPDLPTVRRYVSPRSFPFYRAFLQDSYPRASPRFGAPIPGTVSNRDSFRFRSGLGNGIVDDGNTRDASIVTLKAERERISQRVEQLHRAMMRQPMAERRKNWHHYYRRLVELMKLQAEISIAIAKRVNGGHSE